MSGVRDVTMEFIIFGIVLLIVMIGTIILFVRAEIKIRIHNSYHKGLRHGSKETIRYYETLETLIKRFDNILNEMDISKTDLSLELSKLLFNFKGQLKEFQEV